IGNPDIFPVDRFGRRTLRAEIVGFNPQPDPPGAYFATVEIYNLLTGATRVLRGGPAPLPATRQGRKERFERNEPQCAWLTDDAVAQRFGHRFGFRMHVQLRVDALHVEGNRIDAAAKRRGG